MFLFGFAVGTLAAGTLMYYIQPTVKVAVAKAFGAEPKLIEQYNKLIDQLHGRV